MTKLYKTIIRRVTWKNICLTHRARRSHCKFHYNMSKFVAGTWPTLTEIFELSKWSISLIIVLNPERIWWLSLKLLITTYSESHYTSTFEKPLSTTHANPCARAHASAIFTSRSKGLNIVEAGGSMRIFKILRNWLVLS